MEEEVVVQEKGIVAKPNMPDALADRMKKQGYHFVGKHSATKACGYTVGSLKGGPTCYKHKFYGIRSWRCVQATPAIGCNLACTFCWRLIPEELGIKWNELNAMNAWDDPDSIVEGIIREHKRIVSGYKGNEKVDAGRWKEANDPAHVALSLTGEPLFYPKMNQLLDAFHRRGISTFLVTNGTMVNALRKLTVMPTQLYVSVQAPNGDVYEKTVRPKTLNAWDSFQEFLEVFAGLPTRRVFRMTLVKGLNMVDAKGYAELIRKGNPDYVEVKGFVFVGGSRNPARSLSYRQMPGETEIVEFAKAIAGESGYIYTDYHEHSKVALLCRDSGTAERRIIKFMK